MKKSRIIWKVLKRTGTTKLLSSFLVLFISISILIRVFEPDINNLPDSLWYCFSVMTTIGFGDMTAVTLVGRILSVVLSISSILIIAVIPGVITSYYIETIKLKANQSTEKFLYDLEHLPDLSKEELAELSEKVKKMEKNKFRK